ncbi:MAG TPA: hypothetical protein VFE72_02930 [Lysobacter sp.]|nr:hypothetical protein [Lysobacter sp.]
MKPPCYNRPAFTDPNAGWHQVGTRIDGVIGMAWATRSRPILRYRYPWFTDRCTQYDGTGIHGPAAEHASYAVAMGYDCHGCRHDPRPMANSSPHDMADAFGLLARLAP